MKNQSILKLSVLLILLTFATYETFAMTVCFNMRQLCCDQTTEQGADEVYILIFGESSDGSYNISKRFPTIPRTHWDMNDGDQGTSTGFIGDAHCLTHNDLFTFDLPDGKDFNFTVMVCEEDGGSSLDFQGAARELLSKSDNPYAIAGSVVLDVFARFGIGIKDTDDFMGVFSIRASNKNGVLTASYLPKVGIVHINTDQSYPIPLNKEIRMNHDGSNYVGWFGVTQVPD